MKLKEFRNKLSDTEKYLSCGVNGVCYAIEGIISHRTKLKFIDRFEPTSEESLKWLDYYSGYWLGNGGKGSLSNREKLEPMITRFIALGLFEQIVIDEKLYLEM